MTAHQRRGRLSFVTQWFAPEPITVPVWMARALVRDGWQVQVLTGVPNFPDGKVHEGFSPWRPGNEQRDGVTIRRTPLYPSHDGSSVRRILNYASWAASSAVLGQRALSASDVSLVYSSPATAATAARTADRVHGVPYVLMVQDVWPDSIFASGFLSEGPLRRLAESTVGRYCDTTYARAHAIAVISPGMKDLLVSRGVPASKVEVVYNWVDEDVFRPADRNEELRASWGVGPDDFLLMYAGNHGAAQGLSTAVEAMRLMKDEPAIHFVLVGDGIEKSSVRQFAEEHGLRRVHFLDAVPFSEMRPVVAAADAHLVSLTQQPLFEITMPSKVQSLLAAGQPIIASAPGDAARVVEASGAGFATAPGDATALAEAVKRMSRLDTAVRAGMGAAGRLAYCEQMGEKVGVSRLSAMLEEAASVRRRRGGSGR